MTLLIPSDLERMVYKEKELTSKRVKCKNVFLVGGGIPLVIFSTVSRINILIDQPQYAFILVMVRSMIMENTATF